MDEKTTETTKIYALLRRPDVSGSLRFIDTSKNGLRAALSLEPKAMNHLIQNLSTLVVKLPQGMLRVQDKRQLRRIYAPEMGTVLRAYGSALTECQELKIDPEIAHDLSRKLARCQNIKERSARLINIALDLRLLLGALQWHLSRSVLQAVVARMEDPSCPRAEVEELRDRFSRLLLQKEFLLRNLEETQHVRKERLTELKEEQAQIEKQTLIADVMDAVRQGRPVDRTTLERAALYHNEMQKQKEEAGKTQRRTTRRA